MYFTVYTLGAVSVFGALGASQAINPSSVPVGTRNAWCVSQVASCPLICTQETDGSAATYANTCDAETLAYSCVCDNGLTPNISEYSQTIPYFTCTEYNNQCVLNCGQSNNNCAAVCRTNLCGAQNPTRVNTTSTASGTGLATGSDAAATGTAVYTGFGSSASSTGSSGSSSSSSSSGSSSGAGRLMVSLGQVYGLGMTVAGIFAGFAILL